MRGKKKKIDETAKCIVETRPSEVLYGSLSCAIELKT